MQSQMFFWSLEMTRPQMKGTANNFMSYQNMPDTFLQHEVFCFTASLKMSNCV